MKVASIFLLVLINSSRWVFAQEASALSPWNVGLSGHYGYIIPHSNAIWLISNSNPWGVQLDVSRHVTTQKVWDQCKCYPKIGGSFAYFNYDNPDILGSSLNLLAFIEPYITYKYRVNPSFRLGAGVSYLDNVYDSITNPENLFYSSPISFIVLANITFNIRVNRQWNVHIGGNFNHISNGRIKQPNKGINFPTLKMGTHFYFTRAAFPDRKNEKSLDEIHPSKWKLKLALLTGLKEVEKREPRHAVMGMSGRFTRIVTKINGIHTGVEWLHDGAIQERNKRIGEKVGEPSVWAYLLGHDLLMGRFAFTQTLGFYFNKPFPTQDQMYHRWGLYYTIKDFYYFGLNLKVHGQTADFLDFRIGIAM